MIRKVDHTVLMNYIHKVFHPLLVSLLLVGFSYGAPGGTKVNEASISRTLEPALQDKEALETVGRQLKSYLAAKNQPLDAAHAKYSATSEPFAALTASIKSQILAGRLNEAELTQSTATLNSQVAEFRSYAHETMASKSIAVGALAPLAVELISQLVSKYKAADQKRRAALADQVSEALKVSAFDEL
jgi:hypothetical protein